MNAYWNLDEIKKVENDDNKLYRLLYDISYNNLPHDKNIYDHYLNDLRTDIKKVSIHSILFVQQRKDTKYLEIAKNFIQDDSLDVDLRSTALTGLSKIYQGTCNKEILRFIYKIYISIDENTLLRATAFCSLMEIYGITSTEFFKKNGNMAIEMKDIKAENFKDEIHQIENLIK